MVDAERAVKRDAFDAYVDGYRYLLKADIHKGAVGWDMDKAMDYCLNDVIITEQLMRKKKELEGQEALEALRDIYDELDCPGEAQWRRMNGYDAIYEVPALHMRDYIINKYKYFRDLSELAWEQNKKLKDLINHINEETDI